VDLFALIINISGQLDMSSGQLDFMVIWSTILWFWSAQGICWAGEII